MVAVICPSTDRRSVGGQPLFYQVRIDRLNEFRCRPRDLVLLIRSSKTPSDRGSGLRLNDPLAHPCKSSDAVCPIITSPFQRVPIRILPFKFVKVCISERSEPRTTPIMVQKLFIAVSLALVAERVLGVAIYGQCTFTSHFVSAAC